MGGIVLSFAIAYLIGSIPFGLLIAKLGGHGDIRTIGSGNIGATNVLRTGNKLLALLTLVSDLLKGVLAVFILPHLLPFGAVPVAIGLFAILGHCFPVWLKFKGGKGVATTLGVLLAAVPLAGLVACVTWCIVAGISRISSLAALGAVAVVPLATFLIYGPSASIVTIFITALVFWRHKENIKRLLNATEPRIGKKKDKN